MKRSRKISTDKIGDSRGGRDDVHLWIREGFKDKMVPETKVRRI